MLTNDNDSDRTWKYFGQTNPYFGVLTHEGYKSDKLTEEAKAEFFRSGERYAELVLSTVRERLDASFKPTAGLDFGCGVGRLTIPFAKICTTMTGVDISDGMLAEAKRNCDERNLENVVFAKSDDGLTRVNGLFDFVHSLIVFQHIPAERGERILRRLIDLLKPDGVGVLQFTYAWASSAPSSRRLLTNMYKSAPVRMVRNLVKGRPFREPLMQMNRYDMNRLLRILQESGCHRLHVQFTETSHYGHAFYGTILFFQKRPMDVQAHA